MLSRASRRVIALLAAAVLTLSIAPVASAAPQPGRGPVARPHCVTKLVRVPGHYPRAKAGATRCFKDLASALRFASPASAVPDAVTADQVDAVLSGVAAKAAPSDTTTIIGIHWEHEDRGGRDRIYYVKGNAPCSNGRVWQIPALDAGWDGLVSSAEAFGGCGTFVQFGSKGYGGQSRACTPYCASLGGLNDNVKSVRWRA
ncbi:MAG: hypothetical protein U0869_23620 [Chloroflexota bacterium]